MTRKRTPRELDVLISRLLIGKPNLSAAELRRLMPDTAIMDDHALQQKLEFLRPRARRKAPLLARTAPERE